MAVNKLSGSGAPYHPQFVDATPRGFRDEDFDQFFDNLNTPGLNVPLTGLPVFAVPLTLDPDAAFIWRGIKVPQPGGIQNLWLRFKDPSGNYLQDNFVPAWLFAVPPADGTEISGGQSCVLEPAIECPAAGTVSVDAQFPDGPPGAIETIYIDPANQSYGPVSGTSVPAPGTFGPIVFRNALYIVLQTGASAPSLQMAVYKSQDGGRTWSQLDQVHAPSSNPVAMPIFDNDHTLIFSFCTTSQASPTATALGLINFDLSTETWGTAYASSGAPTTELVFGTYLRPNGEVVVLHNPRFFDGVLGTGSGIFEAVWNGAAWTVNQDIGTGITSLPGYDVTTTQAVWAGCAVQANGALHVTFATIGPSGPPNWNNRLFYQHVSAANVLGSFENFPGIDSSPSPVNKFFSSQPIIVGNNLLLGASLFDSPTGDSFVGIILGQGLDAPVWSYQPAPGIDSVAFGTPYSPYNGDTVPFFYFDGSAIWGVWALRTTEFNGFVLRVGFTTNLSSPLEGWQASSVSFQPTDQGERPSIAVIGNQMYITFELDADTTGRYYLIFPRLEIILTGCKRYPGAAQ